MDTLITELDPMQLLLSSSLVYAYSLGYTANIV